MQNEPSGPERRIAPDGSLLVGLAASEMANTHWVLAPRLTALATGRVLLDLRGEDWDAAVAFPGPQRLRLALRRYRGGHCSVEINAATLRFRIEGGAEGPVEDLPRALNEATRRAAAAAPARPVIRPRPRYGTAALILLAAALAIGGATLARLSLNPEPPRPLDTVPPMPRQG